MARGEGSPLGGLLQAAASAAKAHPIGEPTQPVDLLRPCGTYTYRKMVDLSWWLLRRWSSDTSTTSCRDLRRGILFTDFICHALSFLTKLQARHDSRHHAQGLSCCRIQLLGASTSSKYVADPMTQARLAGDRNLGGATVVSVVSTLKHAGLSHCDLLQLSGRKVMDRGSKGSLAQCQRHF